MRVDPIDAYSRGYRAMSAFEVALRDPASSTALLISPTASSLIIAFGGIGGEMMIPPFEFFKTMEGIDAHRLFVRDRSRAWYQKGVDGFGESIADIAASCRAVATACGAQRVVCIGNSAGGFAALVVGSLLGADQIVAFAPQTFVDRWNRVRFLDLRFRNYIQNARRVRRSLRFTDARPVVKSFGTPQRVIDIFFSEDDRLDRIHSSRLGGLAGVRLHPLRLGLGHGVVRGLRDSGYLRSLLRSAVDGSEVPLCDQFLA